jgi:hypothetical protein
MAVGARFFVKELTKHAGQDVGGSVKLSASLKGEVNKSWAKYTPSGEIMMYVTNPDAFAWFDKRIGQDIVITFDDVLGEPVPPRGQALTSS